MELVDSFLEVTLDSAEDFLKVKETLTRIGISSKREKKLFQSCHILHKRSRYYIVHFKELFLLDGKESNFDVDDMARRNTIALLLDDWGLVRVLNKDDYLDPRAPLNLIKVLTHKEKDEWIIESKYTVGKKRR
jgi:hypothetical protein